MLVNEKKCMRCFSKAGLNRELGSRVFIVRRLRSDVRGKNRGH